MSAPANPPGADEVMQRRSGHASTSRDRALRPPALAESADVVLLSVEACHDVRPCRSSELPARASRLGASFAFAFGDQTALDLGGQCERRGHDLGLEILPALEMETALASVPGDGETLAAHVTLAQSRPGDRRWFSQSLYAIQPSEFCFSEIEHARLLAELRCRGSSAIEASRGTASHVPAEWTRGLGTPFPHLRGGRVVRKLTNEELNPGYRTTSRMPGTKKVRVLSLNKLFPDPFGTLHDCSPFRGHLVRVDDSRAMQRVGSRQCSRGCHVHIVDPGLALVFPDPILPASSERMHCAPVVAFGLGECIAVVRRTAPVGPSGCDERTAIHALRPSLEIVTSILRHLKEPVAPALDRGEKLGVLRDIPP